MSENKTIYSSWVSMDVAAENEPIEVPFHFAIKGDTETLLNKLLTNYVAVLVRHIDKKKTGQERKDLSVVIQPVLKELKPDLDTFCKSAAGKIELFFK